GVGSAAVQIAAEAGARVIAVAGSPQKTAWASELGAHATVDTSAHPEDASVEEVLRLTGGRGADVVLDTVGGRAFARSLRASGRAPRMSGWNSATTAARSSSRSGGTDARTQALRRTTCRGIRRTACGGIRRTACRGRRTDCPPYGRSAPPV